jgi:hypothetical protein
MTERLIIERLKSLQDIIKINPVSNAEYITVLVNDGIDNLIDDIEEDL